MNKKLRGFSLAELLISLLVISLVLSAAIPAITKRSGQQRELIWRWTEENHAAFSAVGANQSVLIGMDSLPDKALSDLFKDDTSTSVFAVDSDSVSASSTKLGVETGLISGTACKGDCDVSDRRRSAAIDTGDSKFSDTGDKISILKRKVDDNASSLMNSHISFYNMNNTLGSSDSYYAGRLSMDEGNIALGIGSLQSIIANGQEETIDSVKYTGNRGENTAIGHYSLLRNKDGYRNTALGKKSLSYNDKGSYNTAAGFGSLFWLGKLTNVSGHQNGIADGNIKTVTLTRPSDGSDYGFENTAFGAEAGFQQRIGNYNTAIGSQAMKRTVKGDFNTAVGQLAMPSADNTAGVTRNTSVGAWSLFSLIDGNNNTALGAGACTNLKQGDNNICIGKNANANNAGLTDSYKDNDGVYIGGGHQGDSETLNFKDNRKKSAPLIMGHTQPAGASIGGVKYPGGFHLYPDGTIYNGSSKETNVSETSHHQELIVHARKVQFNPYNRTAAPLFMFESLVHDAGTSPTAYGESEGYGTSDDVSGAGSGILGVATFDLSKTAKFRLNQAATDNWGTRLRIKGDTTNRVFFDITRPYDELLISKGTKTEYEYGSAVLNNQLYIEPFNGDSTVKIRSYASALQAGSTTDFVEVPASMLLNKKVLIDNTDTAPYIKMTSSDGFMVQSKEGSTAESYLTLKDGSSELYMKTEDNQSFTVKQGEFTANTNTGIVTITGTSNESSISLGSGTSQMLLSGGDITLGKVKYGDTTGALSTVISTIYSDVSSRAKASLELGDKIAALNTDFSSYLNGMPMISSDARLKNILGDNTAGLNEINKLEVKNFTYKDDKAKTKHTGVIAQQLMKVFPNAVSKDENGYYKIRTEDIFYALVNSVKELCAQVQELTAKITGLDKRLKELEAENKLLKEKNAAFEKRFEALEKRQAALEKK